MSFSDKLFFYFKIIKVRLTHFLIIYYRYREKGNIEVQFFNIQAKLKANGQKTYIPPEGMLVHDIETAWLRLEKSEHEREVAMRDEMIR